MIKKHINLLRQNHVDDQISIIAIKTPKALEKMCAPLNIKKTKVIDY